MHYQPTVGADEEFYRLAQALSSPQSLMQMSTIYAAPEKPRDGMVVLADGVRWNPGSGDGLYRYKNGTWKYLG